jgi:hypothetical protein
MEVENEEQRVYKLTIALSGYRHKVRKRDKVLIMEIE